VPSWMIQAWRELRQSFRPGAPGDRDFAALSLLCALLMTALSVAMTAGGGVRTVFADSLMGNIRGAGVPVLVSADITRISQGIDDRAMQIFQNWRGHLLNKSPAENVAPELHRLRFEPLVEIEPSGPAGRLPGIRREDEPELSSWVAAQDGSRVPFRGWGLYRDDPMMEAVRDAQGGRRDPLRTVVLNRSAFEGRFQYSVYRSALSQQLPQSVVAELPERIELDDLSHLWLEITQASTDQGLMRQLVRFDVVWAPSLPGQQQIAFFFPAELLGAAELARSYPSMPFFMSPTGAETEKVSRIAFYDVDEVPAEKLIDTAGRDRFERLADCLRAEIRRGPQTVEIVFPSAKMPPAWLEGCIVLAGLPEGLAQQVDRLDADPPTTFEGINVRVSCRSIAAIAALRQDPVSRSLCQNMDGDELVPLRGIREFQFGHVYVPDRSQVTAVVDMLRAVRIDDEPVLHLGAGQQDAINRLSFLGQAMTYIEMPMYGVGIVVTFYLLAVSLYGIVSGRRRYYGMLLVRGISVWKIYAILAVQLLAVSALGLAISLIGAETLKAVASSSFAASDVYRFAQAQLGIPNPVLLPALDLSTVQTALTSFARNIRDTVAAFVLVLFAAQILGLILLFRLRVRRGTTLIDLLLA